MKRFDLRHLGENFTTRMCEIVAQDLAQGEVGIFIFEVGDFSGVEKSANLVAQNGWTLMNSLRFNEVDWSIVVKKTPPSLRESEANEAIQKNNIDCHDSTQSVESRNDESNSQDSHSIFSTAPINGDTFGAFAVGYQMLSKRHSLSAKNLNHSAFFALDRGWIFVDNALLFALSLDGSAGEFYSINIGAKLGYRALSGRIIPNIAVSYGLINHKINDAQHNFHGATATLSLFVDIVQGFGVEVAYRAGLHPFPTLKKTSEKANIHSFMVNLRFMDFGI